MTTVENKHKASPRFWGKLTVHGKKLFNEMMSDMEDESLIKHPDAKKTSNNHWQTVRWNASFIAAWNISRMEKDEKKAVKPAK